MSPVIAIVIIFSIIGFALGTFLRSNLFKSKLRSFTNKFKKTKEVEEVKEVKKTTKSKRKKKK